MKVCDAVSKPFVYKGAQYFFEHNSDNIRNIQF